MPSAPGARVTVTLSSGLTQSSELYAGGGYLSQSCNTLTFGLPNGSTVKSVRVRWPDGRERDLGHEP